MHLYRLGELTLYSLTDISLIRVPINRVYCMVLSSGTGSIYSFVGTRVSSGSAERYTSTGS